VSELHIDPVAKEVVLHTVNIGENDCTVEVTKCNKAGVMGVGSTKKASHAPLLKLGQSTIAPNTVHMNESQLTNTAGVRISDEVTSDLQLANLQYIVGECVKRYRHLHMH
jgi:hypothetical protein